jgi:hypothetical protein
MTTLLNEISKLKRKKKKLEEPKNIGTYRFSTYKELMALGNKAKLKEAVVDKNDDYYHEKKSKQAREILKKLGTRNAKRSEGVKGKWNKLLDMSGRLHDTAKYTGSALKHSAMTGLVRRKSNENLKDYIKRNLKVASGR